MARHEAKAPLGKFCSLLIGREPKPSRRASCKEICGRRGAADRIGSKSRSGNHRNSEGSDADQEIRGVRCEGTLRPKGGSEEVTAYRRDRPRFSTSKRLRKKRPPSRHSAIAAAIRLHSSAYGKTAGIPGNGTTELSLKFMFVKL